jgi:hypothetical protein
LIEVIEGTIMLVDQVLKTQVATFGGALDDWARANQPTEEQLAAVRDSGKLDAIKAESEGIPAGVAAGMSMDDALEAHALAKRDTLRQPWDCRWCASL